MGLLKNQTDLSAEIYIPQSDPSSAPLEMVMYTEAVGVICSIGNLTLLDEYGTYIGNVLYGSLHYATYVLDRYRHQCILRYLDN